MAKPDDKANIPWSVKGVSKEARQMAKKAAAAEGLTMGEWLSRAIRADAAATTDPAKIGNREPGKESEPGQAPAPARAVEDTAPSESRTKHRISRIVAESEERILGVVQPLHEIIQQISVRIEALEDRARGTTSPALPGPTETNTAPYRKTGWD